MRLLRLLGVSAWAGYLVYAGLAMLLVPWSDAWPELIVRLPPSVGVVLDAPAMRGAISGFGALHLLVVLRELVRPGGGDPAAGERA